MTSYELSPTQRDVLLHVGLCAGSCLPSLVSETGARPSTVESMARLGLVDVRHAGGRDPLVHITKTGRVLWSALTVDPEVDSHQRKETTPMATETVKPDPKPASSRKRTTPAKKDAPAAEGAPASEPVEEVTGQKNEADPVVSGAAKFQPLYDTLLEQVQAAVSPDEEAPETAHLRLGLDGHTLALLKFPTSQSARVKVPKGETSKFDIVKMKEEGDVPVALALITARAETVRALVAAKAEADAAVADAPADEKAAA